MLLALWIFIVLLGNIITVWANNPLKENLATGVIEKRKYLEESTQDNKLVDW
ncbi:transcriptional regulator ['Chrysanthemum coronarium' phytoplasma]|nr:transcriptional regulator ['Chrysanthemum coronarium' phytoplasma]